MLALTPLPLQTEGERALFAELARWDTGGSVRAAVVASIPLGDGQVQRRISDAILFVPEGVAVVRIAEVQRQTGIVTASPEGPWTIAPESGPSQVLQLAGGGSTPLDGLMRAGMDTAMKLRHAGLEPGRIARLTILVGDVTGLVPADGDLGEGDQVATLEPRSLLLGIARASRYSSVDNPRLWTTADVRAALEALGLQGRGPSVEELNGEGFPYSPYVLRRPELLTPAAMAANSTAATDAAPATPTPPTQTPPAVPEQPAVRQQPSAEAIAQAVAASAAAAKAAAVTAAEAPAVAPAASSVAPPQRDTVAIDPPSTPAAPVASAAPAPAPAAPADDGGIGGLFAGAELRQSAAPEAPSRTSVFPATPPAAPESPPPAPSSAPFAYWTESVAGSTEKDAEERNSRGRTLLLVAAGLTVLLLLGIGGWLLLGRESGSGGGAAAGESSAAGSSAAGPVVGEVQNVAGVGYTVEAVQVDDTCSGHAYGEVADFLASTDCTGLSRALYSAETEAGPVVVSVIRVQMPDTATARDLRALADRNGSGNVSDLLREGVRYTGSPAELSGAEYASALSGPTVTIVESAWVDPDTAGAGSEIDRVASDALALKVPPLPEA